MLIRVWYQTETKIEATTGTKTKIKSDINAQNSFQQQMHHSHTLHGTQYAHHSHTLHGTQYTHHSHTLHGAQYTHHSLKHMLPQHWNTYNDVFLLINSTKVYL